MVCFIVLSLSFVMVFLHVGSEPVRMMCLIAACACSIVAAACWLKHTSRVQYLESRVKDLEQINRVRGRSDDNGN